MFDLIDSEEDIVLAKIGKLLTKYSFKVILENGDGKSMLECSGLSSLVNKYEKYLSPHSLNGSFKNSNDVFNPGFAINEICGKIKNDKKVLGMFLNEFISRIKKIDNDDVDIIKNYLSILGYNLEITEKDYNLDDIYQYSLSPYTEGAVERQEDVSFLVHMLNKKHSELMTYYTEAISTYGNTEYLGCIDNSRTLLEKFFIKLDPINDDHNKGFLNATKETVTGTNIPKLTVSGIFKYWIDYKKGFNRYRLFVTIYSLMSALGPHSEEVPSKEDALMCLRITEDILIWCFQHNVGC